MGSTLPIHRWAKWSVDRRLHSYQIDQVVDGLSNDTEQDPICFDGALHGFIDPYDTLRLAEEHYKTWTWGPDAHKERGWAVHCTMSCSAQKSCAVWILTDDSSWSWDPVHKEWKVVQVWPQLCNFGLDDTGDALCHQGTWHDAMSHHDLWRTAVAHYTEMGPWVGRCWATHFHRPGGVGF